MRAPCLLPLALAALLFGPHRPVHGQATVLVISRDGVRLDSTLEVEWTPIGSARRQRLRVGATIGLDDELRSPGGGVLVALGCGGGVVVSLSSSFRVVIAPPAPGAGCVLHLSSGSVDVAGPSGSAVDFGDAFAESAGTVYAVRIAGEPGAAGGEVTVFEGAVKVQPARAANPRRLEQGGAVRVLRAQSFPVMFNQGLINHSAEVYAALDAARLSEPAGRASAYQELLERYRQVLRAPQDADARIGLGVAAAKLGVASPVVLYQLERAKSLNTTRQQKAAAGYVQSILYDANGEAVRARAVRTEAVRQDPDVVAKVQRSYGVTPRTLQVAPGAGPALVATLTASPATLLPGHPTTLLVTVRTTAGQPVPGVSVTVNVGGGEFLPTGAREYAGRTDSDGRLRVQWRCQPCAAGYGFGATVATPDGRRTQAETTVRIQPSPSGGGGGR